MSKSVITRSLLFATIAIFGSSVHAQSFPGWPNPVIWDSGKKISGITYDPFSGRVRIKTDHTKVRESVNDPNRGYVDPGSYHQVNEYQTDRNGTRWHVTGTRWTSNGVPHGNLNRRRVSGVGPGIDHEENENVIYSPGTTQSNKTVRQPQTRRVQSTPTRVQGQIWNPRPTNIRTTQPVPIRVNRPVYRANPFTPNAPSGRSVQTYNPF